jgi:hypothetical protein
MPARAALLGDRTICGERRWAGSGDLNPGKRRSPLAGQLMGVLGAVLEIAGLPVFGTGQALPLGRPVAFPLIGDEHPWDARAAVEPLAGERLRRLLIAPTWHEEIEDRTVLVYRPPQIVMSLVDRDEYLSPIKRLATPLGNLPSGRGEHGSADSRPGLYQL